MEKLAKKRAPCKPAPISEQAYNQLQIKYGFAIEELQAMARELRMGRPKLEMHLIYLTMERKKMQAGYPGMQKEIRQTDYDFPGQNI